MTVIVSAVSDTVLPKNHPILAVHPGLPLKSVFCMSSARLRSIILPPMWCHSDVQTSPGIYHNLWFYQHSNQMNIRMKNILYSIYLDILFV